MRFYPKLNIFFTLAALTILEANNLLYYLAAILFLYFCHYCAGLKYQGLPEVYL